MLMCNLTFLRHLLCILMVDGMFFVVNVILFLMSVMSPPLPCAVCMEVKLCTLGVFFCFNGELGFLNSDDICICVVHSQFELLEFVFDSVYFDLQYDEISLTFIDGPVCCM